MGVAEMAKSTNLKWYPHTFCVYSECQEFYGAGVTGVDI
jgi:hypothetical protein